MILMFTSRIPFLGCESKIVFSSVDNILNFGICDEKAWRFWASFVFYYAYILLKGSEQS